eukprot:GHVH01005379.1.p1 GENE.GHVH01005379.1~~GHVH01005379.1.p1  ORF type:complete len:674 (+),score=108.87 GHVH01005379.1:1087-3108(+)
MSQTRCQSSLISNSYTLQPQKGEFDKFSTTFINLHVTYHPDLVSEIREFILLFTRLSCQSLTSEDEIGRLVEDCCSRQIDELLPWIVNVPLSELSSYYGYKLELNLVCKEIGYITSEEGAKKVFESLMELILMPHRCLLERNAQGHLNVATSDDPLEGLLQLATSAMSCSALQSESPSMEDIRSSIASGIAKCLLIYPQVIESVIESHWSLISDLFPLVDSSSSSSIFVSLAGLYQYLARQLGSVASEINQSQAAKKKELKLNHIDEEEDLLVYGGLWSPEKRDAMKSLLLKELARVRPLSNVVAVMWCERVLPVIWPLLSLEDRILWHPLLSTVLDVNSNESEVSTFLKSEEFMFGSWGPKITAEALALSPRGDLLNIFYTPHHTLSGSCNVSAPVSRHADVCRPPELVWGPTERAKILRPLHLILVTLWVSVWRNNRELDYVESSSLNTDDPSGLAPPVSLIAHSVKVKHLVKSVDSLCKLIPSSSGSDASLASLVLAHATGVVCSDARSLRPSLDDHYHLRFSSTPESPPLADLVGRWILMLSITAPASIHYQLTYCIHPLAVKVDELSPTLWKGVMKAYCRIWDSYFCACMDGVPHPEANQPRHPLPDTFQSHWGMPLMMILKDLRRSDVEMFRNGLNDQSVSEVVKMIHIYSPTGTTEYIDVFTTQLS